LTDSAGTTAKSYSYDAYGNILESPGTLEQPYTYTGREFDSESGLSYYRARYYDPTTGRFLQKDPIGFAGGDLNLYPYVRGNPANAYDPHGEFAMLLPLIGGAGGAGAAAGAIVSGAELISAAATAAIIYAAINVSGDTPADQPGDIADADTKNCPPGDPCKGFRKQLQKHEQKLKDYSTDPFAHDNKGFLAKAFPALQQKIIQTRTNKLQGQIDNFRKLLAECEARNQR
jgi:RHS repeat-associated protein